MNEEKKSTITSASIALPPEHSSVGSERLSYNPIVQNFLLVWFDIDLDGIRKENCITYVKSMRIFNKVYSFNDMDQCIDFVTDIQDQQIFMIFSGVCSKSIMVIIHDIPQFSSFYILSEDKAQEEGLKKYWPKIAGLFTDIASLCKLLQEDAYRCEQNSLDISIIPTSNGSYTENLDQLDQSFMYTQILKEILLNIDFKREHFDGFISFCRQLFEDDPNKLRAIENFRQEYNNHQPIWWYTCEYFLYSMINRSLRMMEVDLIIIMGFFLQDLYNNITELHAQQFAGHANTNYMTVYRGQGLSREHFDQVVKSKGGLLSFNNFLSTSLNRNVSLQFAESNQSNPNFIGILFEININPFSSTTAFAQVHEISQFKEEEEILFSMHSIFRIQTIQKINDHNGLWQIDLTLTDDNDPELHALTEEIRKEINPQSSTWNSLGIFLIKLGQFNKAKDMYNIWLHQTTNYSTKIGIYYQLGFIKLNLGEYADAIRSFEQCIEIAKMLSSSDANLASPYVGIGMVYYKMHDYVKSLSYYQDALKIEKNVLEPSNLHLATIYNNIGIAYGGMGDYLNAVSAQKDALNIRQKALSSKHPDLAQSYNNIGSLYYDMGDYSNALSFFQTALDIRIKSLPPNHPDYAESYNNIGTLYDLMNEKSKALSFYEKSLKILQTALPSDHPHSAIAFKKIASVYWSMKDYSNALLYYQKALQVDKKCLPPNHTNLAEHHNNIGILYNMVKDYPNALLSLKQALQILQKALPENHPDLAEYYANIGLIYFNMKDHSNALSFLQKGLEIYRNTLGPNHPDLVHVYNLLGLEYQITGAYANALSLYRNALEIQLKRIPSDHSDLILLYTRMGEVYSNLRKHSDALSSYQKALEIQQKSFPLNHPDLVKYHNRIGEAYYKMGDYSNALISFVRALDIQEKALPPNHPDLAFAYNSIAVAYAERGEYSTALLYAQRAVEIARHSLSPNNPDLQSFMMNKERIKKGCGLYNQLSERNDE